MNRHLIPIGLLVVVFVLLLSGGVNAQTAPPNPPALQPSCPYVLRAGIPFAWLRFDASSLSGWSITLYPGQTVQLLDSAAVRWDGVQWWVNVWPNAAPGHGYYWVEIGSLEPRCPPAATATPTLIPGQGAANWRVNDTLMVVARVPFVWLRQFPAPGNPPILTAFPGQQMKIIDATPRLDSFNQWWWNVRDVRTGTIGWVEQISVALLSGSGTLPPSEWLANDVV
ncbi:MAG: hypothetical protein JNJ61_28175, partial [Anaerolineae bacterium]|nr:hypothetical protein [Anaerolineae bacterium]